MSAARLATTAAPPHRAIADMVRLDLPEPPSAAELFSHVSDARRAMARAAGRELPGHLKTRAYLTWSNAAGWAIERQGAGRIDGEYEMSIQVGAECTDIANLRTAVTELLVDHGVLADGQVGRRLIVDWCADMPAKRISVTLRPRWQA